MLPHAYDPWLVAASFFVAMLASYTSLEMAGRIFSRRNETSGWWLIGGSIAMGVGIWSMHFIGMLAFRLPIPMGYDPMITLVSLLIAVASSAFALWIVCTENLVWTRLFLGALLMGSGVCTMHYTGMAAMRMSPRIRYDPSLFVFSFLIAIAASGAALWIAFSLRFRFGRTRRLRAGASVVMGVAIAGMHYTGMSAAQFPVGSVSTVADAGMNSGWMALVFLVFACGVLAIAVLSSTLDLRTENRTSALANSLADVSRELRFLALHDGLTKLPNRGVLEDRLGQRILNTRRPGETLAVLLLDLDGLMQINDAFGYRAGDLLLIEVAARIRLITRNYDTLARIGGDEFVLVAKICDPMAAASLAERLRSIIAQPFALEGEVIQVSASIGIALHEGGELTAHQLIRNAHAAMHHAKTEGRNRSCFFDRSIQDDAHHRLQLLHALHFAQGRQELALYYQPLVSARSGQIVGAEALLRWQHPEYGMIPPDRFIPLAEREGLIVPIGTWVLDEACCQLKKWHAAGCNHWSVSVNLSAEQLSHPDLVGTIQDTLERHLLDPAKLTLEITESTAMRDPEQSVVILKQLSELGVRISIDDFGTGYSSFLYLKRFPAHELKVDRGFVRDLAHDSEDAAIIAAIVTLGRTLNLAIVAEGVETVEQRELLADLGCEVLQGYLLGLPVPADQFPKHLGMNA